MRRCVVLFVVMMLCSTSVLATESQDLIGIREDDLIQELPCEASELLEDININNPSWIDSVLSVIVNAFGKLTDSIRQGLRTSGILLIIALLCGVCSTLSTNQSMCVIVGALGIFSAVLGSVGAMIRLSGDTIKTLTEYSGLLLPVMASAMAVSGNPIAAGGLQALTALFCQLFMRIIINVLIPGVYLYLALAVGEAALQNTLLGELREFISWIIEKVLRILMYVFTAFLSMTGVISGSTDALTVKTTKAAVSGMVPVVGSILSDASDTLLAGAATVKNTVGIIGMTAVLGIVIVPFLRIGIQYLIIKATAACSGTVALKEHTALLKHISSAMGLLLAMTGACAMLLLISGVCYLKVSAF